MKMNHNNPKIPKGIIINLVIIIATFIFVNYIAGLIFLITYILNSLKSFSKNQKEEFIKDVIEIENVDLLKNKIEKRKKYLQISLNSRLEVAQEIVLSLPKSDRVLIEVGSSLINRYGTMSVSGVKIFAPTNSYIIADCKCADLAPREVKMMANAGASAATCLGVAPIETIDSFIEECQKFNIDSMIDMMNVESAIEVLKKLKKLPNVVILNKGSNEINKQIPFYQINQIKGNYNLFVAVSGSQTIKEVQSAIFNAADIVVVGEDLYNSQQDQLVETFLKKIK
ncbi:MAG: orotidine 5'-phosphate decarboxylase / HUMPS family protein [Minisyncoccales bacterium]|jgi:3-keto-L-gulonate-6-phosphate decarboxylase